MFLNIYTFERLVCDHECASFKFITRLNLLPVFGRRKRITLNARTQLSERKYTY